MKENLQLKKSATNREKVLWVSVLAVLLVSGFNHFMVPSFKKTKDLKAKIEYEKIQLQVIKNFKSSNLLENKSVSKLKRENIKKKVQQALASAQMSPDVLISEIMSLLTGPQFQKMASMNSFTVKEEKDQKSFTEIKFEVGLVGKYRDVAQYLRGIRELPFLISTEMVQIKPHTQEGSQKVQVLAKNVLFIPQQKNPRSGQATKTKVAFQKSQKTGENTSRVIGSSALHRAPFSSKPGEAHSWSLYNLKLTGILSGGRKPSALINGKVFTLGDGVAGCQITQIRPQEVVLQNGSILHVLKIEEMKSGTLLINREDQELPNKLEEPTSVEKTPSKEKAQIKEEFDDEIRAEDSDEFIEEYPDEDNNYVAEEELEPPEA